MNKPVFPFFGFLIVFLLRNFWFPLCSDLLRGELLYPPTGERFWDHLLPHERPTTHPSRVPFCLLAVPFTLIPFFNLWIKSPSLLSKLRSRLPRRLNLLLHFFSSLSLASNEPFDTGRSRLVITHCLFFLLVSSFTRGMWNKSLFPKPRFSPSMPLFFPPSNSALLTGLLIPFARAAIRSR